MDEGEKVRNEREHYNTGVNRTQQREEAHDDDGLQIVELASALVVALLERARLGGNARNGW